MALMAGISLILGAIGIITVPQIIPLSVLFGLSAGGAVYFAALERAKKPSPHIRRVCRQAGLRASGIAFSLCVVVTGLAVVLGETSGPVILLLLLVTAPWTYSRTRRALGWQPSNTADIGCSLRSRSEIRPDSRAGSTTEPEPAAIPVAI